MQSAANRDDYVSIAWEHIRDGTQNNFKKYNATQVTNFEVPYDYDSILHYSAYAFTKDGFATIIPRVRLVDKYKKGFFVFHSSILLRFFTESFIN